MRHATFELQTHEGGRLFAQSWTPEEPSIGAVGIVHGLGEHSRRHEWFAKQLTQSGFEVVSFDLRGHGQTDGRRGHVLHFDWLMEDISQLVDELHERLSDGPCFLFGQSLGGSLALNFALRAEHELNGVIAASPLLELARKPNVALRTAVRALSWLWPSFHLRTGIRSEDLTADSTAQKAHKADELIHGKVSARMAVHTVDASRWALENAALMTVPSLLIHGAHDRVTSCTASSQFCRTAGGDSQFVEIDNGRHELLQGDGRNETSRLIVEWLHSQCTNS